MTHTRTIFGCLFMAATLTFPLTAQAGQMLELYQRAQEQDPRFLSARYEYMASQEAKPIARAALLPSLGMSYESIDTTQDIVRSDNSVFGQGQTSFPTTNTIITLRQPLFRWELWQAYAQAKLAVARSERRFAAEEQALILRLAESYLNVLAAEDAVNLARAEKAAIDRNLELVDARRSSGLANRTDLYDAEARAAVAEVQLVEALNALMDARQALSESVGDVPESLSRITPNLELTLPEPAEEQAWVDAAIQSNLELMAAADEVQIAVREVKRRKAGHWPTLDLVYTNSDRDTEGTLFGGGSQVKSTEMMILFEVPIYSGGATQAGVRESTALLGSAEEDLRLLQRQVERETRAAFRGVVTGTEKVRSLRASVQAQLSAVDAKEKGYRAGLNTVLDVLDAQRDLYYIQREYAQARYDYLRDQLRLKAAAGRLAESDLMALDGMLIGGEG